MVIQIASMGSTLSQPGLPISTACMCETVRAVHDLSKQVIACYYRYTNRPVRNLINGSCATCLSYWGGAIAGDMCLRGCLHLTSDNTAARLGSVIAALGNLCSWISAYENEIDPNEALPLLRQENAQLRQSIEELNQRLTLIENANKQNIPKQDLA